MNADAGTSFVCPECGRRYGDGTFFCVKCGARLRPADAPARKRTATKATAATPGTAAAAPLGAPHILMVEDSELFIALTVDQLRANGIEVTVAKTGGEALHVARTLTPTLVLMDVELPDGLGDDFARELVARYYAGVPIYLYSSLSDAVLATRARRAGCTGFISKQRGVHAMIFDVQRILTKLGAL